MENNLRKYLFKNKIMMAFFILLVPLSCFFSIKFALSFEPVINSAINKNLNMLKISAMWCGIYAILDCFFLLIVKYIKENILKETFVNLKNHLFTKILKFNTEAFNEFNTGTYISILDNDVKLLGDSYYNNILSLYNVIVSFIFSFITVFFLNYTITIILIMVAVSSIIIPKFFDKKLANLQEKYSENMKRYTSQIKDFFDGFQVIKSFNIQDKIIRSNAKLNKIREKSGCEARKTVYLAGWISMLFRSAMYVITYVIGGYFAIIGAISVGLVISLSQLIGGVVAPLEQVPAILAEINSTLKIRNKLEQIINKKVHEEKGQDLRDLPLEVLIKNISFNYKNSEVMALNNINMKFKEGKQYAIVGESGSGKSTIAKLLLNFYKYNNGEIKINDIEISKIDSSSLYKTIGYIHQNIFLFDDTLKNNITLYNKYSDKEIMDVIEASGLSEFIKRLPKGLNTNVGENGSIFSGGERQRIGIARALICKAKFLILDEATSSLDNITANEINNSVLSLQDTSTIVITHQLSYNLLSKCDYIYVMKNGRIIEEGSLEELIDNKLYFYNLYNVNEKYNI
ncbi:ABC transporter ATP-binding protein [Clostridium sp.]|uniref:ABC transporter ATP-binding protein n=1 Tax=Clostridium sp. TaxID=1506 RepID=UPI001D67A626|nr:ABC transporter ATP-binding protein [Clostridium sp.]MBS5939036.1 ABC transporter ATP-binding protein [Clostridium sp.]